MMGRQILEMQGRSSAGILDETEDWYWVRVLNAFEMYVMKDDQSVSPHLVNDGFWESWITAWVVNQVNKNTTFFDVGAHTGYYAMIAYNMGARVEAFEPNPRYYDMLAATIDRAGINKKDFILRHVALSDYTGYGELHVPKGLHGSASLNDIPAGYDYDDVLVPVGRMNDITFPRENRKNLVKIDAEGEEERVLAGASEMLHRAPFFTLMMEWTPGAYSNHFFDRLSWLCQIEYIDFDGSTKPVNRDWLMSQTDWVMLVLKRRP